MDSFEDNFVLLINVFNSCYEFLKFLFNDIRNLIIDYFRIIEMLY